MYLQRFPRPPCTQFYNRHPAIRHQDTNNEIVLVSDSLGPEYGEARILDLEATWKESEPTTPLICILSIGSDPSPQITALAKSTDTGMFRQHSL